MSSIVNEMIAEKLDQVILLLQARTPHVTIDEQMAAMHEELKAFRHGLESIQLRVKSNTQNPALTSVVERLESAGNVLIQCSKDKQNQHVRIWIFVSVALFIAVLFIAWQWQNEKQLADRFSVSDIKYRYLKTIGGMSVRRYCRRVDSLYLSDQEIFVSQVELGEKRQQKISDSAAIVRPKK